MANYTKGNSKQIIVGAAALFAYDDIITEASIPDLVEDEKFTKTLTNEVGYRNVGYTSNGLEIQFTPDFGEVKVDQILDVAKLYKQGMKVNLKTSFAEATLQNLLFAVAGKSTDLHGVSGYGANDTWAGAGNKALELSAGEIGECPVERGLIAVGPGTGDCAIGSELERIYVAYRALSIEQVNVAAKRDTATMFDVTFRLLPEDTSSSYGKIVDRSVSLVS